MSSGPRLPDKYAHLDAIDAVVAMMIIAEVETRPFTLLEQVAVDAITMVATYDPMGVPSARELMARFARARSS